MPHPALAVDCASVPISGNYSVTTACSFASTVNGVDAGTGDTNTAVLTIGTGGALTISASQTVAVGSISLTAGYITIVDTGVIKIGTPLYITDADGDGYPPNTTQYTTSAAGRIRRNSLTSFTTDCNDANISIFRTVAGYLDADSDGYGAGAYTTCAGATGTYVANNTDCKDTGAYAAYVMFSGLTCYYDSDNDDYGQNTARTCMNTQSCATATWGTTGAADDAGNINFSSNNTDCNDATSTQYQNRTCYYDGDNDGYRTTASATRCVGADCTSSSDAYKRESSATIDCNDAVYSATNTCCTDTWVCDTCYDTCCASCCSDVGYCGGTCTGCASGPFAGCNPTNYDVWNAAHTCYCSYCAIYYDCAPCVNCNPYSCNCRWVCI